jgi:uncharacterized protein YoxC
MIFDILASYSEWIVGVSAGLVILYGLLVKVRKKVRKGMAKINQAIDTLLGREAVLHPETGDVLVEATPNLGSRFARMEDAIVKMADTTTAVTALTKRVDDIAVTVSTHIRTSETEAITRHEEQKAMWDAIKAVAQSAPATETTTTVTTTT